MKAATPPALISAPMALALCANFGSVPKWREAFIAMAGSNAASAGRLELAFMTAEGTLVHRWASRETNSGVVVLTALELPADANAFVDGIDWPQVYQRYTEAVHAASAPFAAQPDDLDGEALLLDVRRAGVFEAVSTRLAGASWRDPVTVGEWARALPADREVIVYCVFGHEVGRVTAMRLRAQGVNARFLLGGIDGWERAGRRTVPKGEAA